MTRNRANERELVRAATALAIPVAAAVAGDLLDALTWVRMACVLAGGVAGLAVLASATLARARRLAAVEEGARRLLGAASPQWEPPGALGAGPEADELSPLRTALDELGRRITSQLKEVAKKTRNLEALIDALDEPVLATDNADAILLCNRSAEAMFDAGRGGLVGRPIGEVLTQAELLDLHGAAHAGQTRRGRLRVTTPLGARTFQVSAAPVPMAWGEGIFGAVLVLRDVTELDQAVQVKTDFVANASHELRTPVAAIRGSAETLAHAITEDPAIAARLVQMILDHAQRLEDMLRDLLDLSRLESPDMPVPVGPVDLEALAAELRSFAEPARRERGLGLEIELGDGLSALRTDPSLLLLILRNLVENALKFAYDSTTVRVTGRLTDGQIARFEVIDKGIGVPLNLQDRVFERYFQVDTARTGSTGRRGTGLGLAIVKHAAKVLGGRAGLSSVWREGTTAWVEIPVTGAPHDRRSTLGVGSTG